MWGVMCQWKLIFCIPIWIFFPENMGATSGKHGERFQQDISQIEKKYSRKWSPYILTDSCWSLIRETPAYEYKRQKKTKWVFNEFFST